MMTAFNQMSIEFRQDEIDRSICDRFEKVVQACGDRVAIKTPTGSLTYQQLNQAANRLAQAILQQQVEEKPIALLFDHDAPCLIAMLGVLKAGNAYTVLDVSAPSTRLAHILEDLQPSLLITNHQNLAVANQFANHFALLNLDLLDETLTDDDLKLPIPPDALASVFYTSGSTGKPKGVKRHHYQILYRSYLEVKDYEIGMQDRIAFLYSCSFAASSSDIFNTLLSSATLHFYDIKNIELNEFSDWLIQSKITILHLPVMLLRQWLNRLSPVQSFPSLRLVIPSGKLYRKDVERARNHIFDYCRFIQRFSSTETGAVTRFEITPKTEITSTVVPVGYVLPGYEILLVDDAGEPVGSNQVGEILVKSQYLSSGYWQKPELTAQKFHVSGSMRTYCTGDLGRLHPDGCLELVGRKDFMVKIRGYRVEPSEIESALAQLDAIEQAAVVAQKDGTDEPQLLAYIVPKQQPAPDVSTLRRALLERLPDYMIPAAFVVLEALPTTLNGKLDRTALPPADWSRPNLETAFVAPRTPLEKQVAEIWMTVLKLNSIGVHDKFLELGGHSLQAMQIVTRVAQEFQVDFSIKLLFQAATIAAMSEILAQHQAQTTIANQVPKILMKPREGTQIHSD